MIIAFVTLALSQLASKNSPETYLGEVGAESVFVQQFFTQMRYGRTALKLRFFCRRHGIPSGSKDFDVWDSSKGLPDVFCVGYYVGNGRRQVFVSMIDQRIVSYLLDYDGKNVHVLYEPGEGRWYGGGVGRVQAVPTWDEYGGFGIREKFSVKEKKLNGHLVFLENPYTLTRTVHIKTGQGANRSSHSAP